MGRQQHRRERCYILICYSYEKLVKEIILNNAVGYVEI
jgi:hypothetical protein